MAETYHNPFAAGINTCQAATLLRKDHLEHLAFIKAYTGAHFLRCHGIFHDRIGVASRAEDGSLRFHFAQAHKVYDNLLELGFKPWVELSFLPRALAADPAKTLCWYQAHVSNPTSYKEWGQLVGTFVRSLVRRYGRRELGQWRFEVWNEPNIVFWQPAGDKFAQYMKLYSSAAAAVKGVDKHFRVGGPSTARGEWIGDFIRACLRRRLPVDFISTHLYPADEFEIHGQSVRQKFGPFDFYPQLVHGTNDLVHDLLGPVEIFWGETNATHRAAEKSDKTGRYPSWELFAGEPTWGKRQVDDTPQSGAYAALLAGTMTRPDVRFFWWTVSDIYEEWEPDSRPYHGGRGLVNLQGIPKPIAHALHFAHRMDGGTILAEHSDGGAGYLAVRKGRQSMVLAWNYAHPELRPAARLLALGEAIGPAAKKVRILLVDQTHANGHHKWQQLGSPLDLEPATFQKVHQSSRLFEAPAGSYLTRRNELVLQPNSFALLETDP